MQKHKKMVLTEVFTGLKKNQDKKMEQLKGKFGQKLQDI
jgi:hypothetical protein